MSRINDLRRRSAALSPFDQGILWLLVAWALAMLVLPLLKALLGENALAIGISVGVLIQLITVWAILIWAWGARRAALIVVGIAGLAWGIEYVGHTSGFPFGAYAYTDRLQPQIGGVPLLIPLAWLVMLPPVWALARRIAGGGLRFVAVSALAFTVWDLLLDPQMVGWNLWTWTQPGGYFGIPLSNFAGWLIASALITALASALAPLRDLPARPLMAIYAITWALEVVGLLCFWGLPGPALIGGAAMGAMLLWGARSVPERAAA